jgi:hypothetical protein
MIGVYDSTYAAYIVDVLGKCKPPLKVTMVKEGPPKGNGEGGDGGEGDGVEGGKRKKWFGIF